MAEESQSSPVDTEINQAPGAKRAASVEQLHVVPDTKRIKSSHDDGETLPPTMRVPFPEKVCLERP